MNKPFPTRADSMNFHIAPCSPITEEFRKAQDIKPRLKYIDRHTGWSCSGSGWAVVGDTPREAYSKWADGFLNFSR